jgi:hypothetical protein
MENGKTGLLGPGQHPWQFLSGTAVKAAGVVLMTMDHLHQMFIAQGAPQWLGWFGRPVATMFIFLCAEGFFYTRNKKRYLLLLLGGFFFMAAMNRILSVVMPVEEIVLLNNIFSTLFMAAFYMWMIDRLKRGVEEKNAAVILSAIGGFLFPFIISLALILVLQSGNPRAALIFLFIPNPVSAEGGFILVFMGVFFYIFRKYRLAQAALVLVISAVSWYGSRNIPASGEFQWLMCFAVIPIFLYNGKQGRGGKYFFYVFYPAHIYLFYGIAWFLGRQAGGVSF